MAGENNSANMSMPVPGVGITTGPTYATDINNCLTILDSHDHSAGKGVPVTPAGLNISSDLSFLSNNATALRSIRFTVQGSLFSLAADVGALYINGVDLYYRDISGNNVRITSAGAVAGTPGSISNLVAPASATYVPGSSTFVWQSNALTPANMDAAAYIFRNLSASSFGLTLNPPTAMGADSSITLPTVPGVTSFLTIDASGNIGSSTALSGALTTSNLSASAGILGSQLSATAAIEGFQLLSGTLTSTQMGSNIQFPGKRTNVENQVLVVSNTNASTNNISIIRIVVNSAGVLVGGEGATSVRNSPGVYTVTFVRTFFDTPSVCLTAYTPGTLMTTPSVATSSVVINSTADTGFSLIAIGQNA